MHGDAGHAGPGCAATAVRPGRRCRAVRERVAKLGANSDAARTFFGGGPSDPVPVVRNLNNPRQVTLLPSQGLLVSEAGRGGDVEIPGTFGPTYVGPSGSVSWVPVPSLQKESSPVRIVRGLASSAGPDGSFAIGSNGVGARSLASIDIPMLFENPDFAASLPPDLARQAGKLLRSNVANRTRVFADIAQWEIDNDPDGSNDSGDTISNPYAALSQRNRTLVADAGANTVVSVDRKGKVSLFALLPDPPPFEVDGFDTDAVPTSLAEDRHGNIYVGTLASDLPGEAAVYVYGPDGGDPIDVIKGFTTVTGVAVGRDGSIYVSELFGGDPAAIPPGQLTKIASNGERTTIPVPLPAGVAVDRWNNVYVAVWSVASADGLVPPEAPAGTPPIPDSDGQVWRLRF